MEENITEYCETLAEFRNNAGKEEQEDKIIDNGFILLIEQTTRKNFLIDIYYYYLLPRVIADTIIAPKIVFCDHKCTGFDLLIRLRYISNIEKKIFTSIVCRLS